MSLVKSLIDANCLNLFRKKQALRGMLGWVGRRLLSYTEQCQDKCVSCVACVYLRCFAEGDG